MAVTGTGTQADPFIVHSYTEFVSLSNTGGVDDNTLYIKFFDEPNQILNCNRYGSDFAWGNFHVPAGTVADIDLNGATIKNLRIADNTAMFTSGCWSSQYGYSNWGEIHLHNGKLLNVFAGVGSSRLEGGGAINIENMSISANANGITNPFIDCTTWATSNIKNSAIYVEAAKLNANIYDGGLAIKDSDLKMIVGNLNRKWMLSDRVSLSGCRIRGKAAGLPPVAEVYPYGDESRVFEGNKMTNCVVDFDVSEITGVPSDRVFLNFDTSTQITVISTENWLAGLTPPNSWQYCSHSDIRDATYLNGNGFTVVDVGD